MNQIVKNTLALFTITAVAGLLLGAVYEGTKSARASQAEKTQQKKRHPDSRKFPWTRQKIFPIRKKKLSLIQR